MADPGETVLLMTATIAPASGVAHQIVNPEHRLEEYRRALEFNTGFLGRGIDRILFAENSGVGMGRLRAAVRGAPVEFIDCRHPSGPEERRKDYGAREMRLVDMAMDHELRSSRHGTRWIKVTGRYCVRNLDRVIAHLPHADLLCDVRNHRRPWLDMRLFGWTRRGYETALRNSWRLLSQADVHTPPEITLARHLLDMDMVSRALMFAVEPQVDGRRGFDGQDWGRGRLRFQARLRGLLRPGMALLSGKNLVLPTFAETPAMASRPHRQPVMPH